MSTLHSISGRVLLMCHHPNLPRIEPSHRNALSHDQDRNYIAHRILCRVVRASTTTPIVRYCLYNLCQSNSVTTIHLHAVAWSVWQWQWPWIQLFHLIVHKILIAVIHPFVFTEAALGDFCAVHYHPICLSIVIYGLNVFLVDGLGDLRWQEGLCEVDNISVTWATEKWSNKPCIPSNSSHVRIRFCTYGNWKSLAVSGPPWSEIQFSA
jgi:hypothetical protein